METNNTAETNPEPAKKKGLKDGRWNLLILGVLSIVFAVITTSVSLLIYHNSGDIYLDRSRPGYLPEEDEIGSENETELEYELGKSGKMTMEVLEEYLDNLNTEIRTIDAYEEPFGPDVLSDERLGIPKE